MTKEEATKEADKLCQAIIDMANATSWCSERSHLNVVLYNKHMTKGFLQLLVCCAMHEHGLGNESERRVFHHAARRFAIQHFLLQQSPGEPKDTNKN